MVDYELNDLKREFLEEARDKVDEMQTALTSSDGSDVLERLGYLAHQLKGSGGSYGYSRISEDAAELEKAVESLDKSSGVSGSRDQLLTHVNDLRNAIEVASAELKAE